MRLMGTTARAARPRVCMGRRSRPIHQPAEHAGGAVSGGTGLGWTVGRKAIGVIQKDLGSPSAVPVPCASLRKRWEAPEARPHRVRCFSVCGWKAA